jgi:hypothetical protein
MLDDTPATSLETTADARSSVNVTTSIYGQVGVPSGKISLVVIDCGAFAVPTDKTDTEPSLSAAPEAISRSHNM